MAANKILTDRNKWEDPWFAELDPILKLLWLFLIDRCDNAGVWSVNKKMAEFVIKSTIDWEAAKVTFNGRVVEISADKWFIPKYLKFQYPQGLTENSNYTSGVIKKLNDLGLSSRVERMYGRGFLGLGKSRPRVVQGLTNTTSTPQYKDKYKYKYKDKDKNTTMLIEAFEHLWSKYPNKDGKKEAFVHWQASVKSKEDIDKIGKALENYLQTDTVKRGFIKKGATWFNNWQDWIDFKGVGVEDEGRRMLPIPEEDKNEDQTV